MPLGIKMSFPIADLHCDLLWYLSEEGARTPYDPESRASLPQLKEGGVFFQTMAIFTETGKGSSAKGLAQVRSFLHHLQKDVVLSKGGDALSLEKSSLYVIPAVENGSSLCEEDEPLEECFKRLEALCEKIAPPLYVSLTWNGENRFGGGCFSDVGLKEDGKHLLDVLAHKKIAIDFSHTSDPLAEAIFNYIDQKGLLITPIASHSNFRAVHNHPRNLPDSFVKEIVKRGGVIGFNGVKKFVGDNFFKQALKHLEYAKEMGVLKHLCFGADFFCDKGFLEGAFDESFQNASCYPRLMEYCAQNFTEEELKGIAHQNFMQFFTR